MPPSHASEPAPGVQLRVGDRLIAYTGSLLGALDPKALIRLPVLTRPGTEAETLAARLIRSCDPAVLQKAAAALVIATRVLPGQALNARSPRPALGLPVTRGAAGSVTDDIAEDRCAHPVRRSGRW
jgi:hypothetical protein